MLTRIFLTLIFIIASSAPTWCLQESELYKKDLRLINVPVAGIYVQPNSKSTFDTQVVYGHEVEVVHLINEKWAKVITEDGVIGFCHTKDMIPDNVVWRTSSTMQRVKVRCAYVHPTANVVNQPIICLPYNAYISVVEISPDTKWAQIELANGQKGWLMTGDIEPLSVLSRDEIVARAQQFVGVPYLWGGNSSFGYDCSAFTQTLARQMGYPMQRNSGVQSQDAGLLDVAYADIQPGDFVYLNGEIARARGYYGVNHVGLCVAPGKIIHAGVIENEARISVIDLDYPTFHFKCAKRIPAHTYQATICNIDAHIFKKMSHSWQKHNPVPLKDLRRITLNYWGFDNCVHTGEIIVHAEVAQEVADIFRELFEHHFPIERMNLIDAYNAIDGLACADNNSSAFCSRLLTNSTTKWSLHSFGIAIDINTRLNPYHKGDYIGPVNGAPFLDRTLKCKGLIVDNDVCVQAFKKRGWKWAGDWQEKYGYVDYQHFYKEDGLSASLTALAQKYTPKLD